MASINHKFAENNTERPPDVEKINFEVHFRYLYGVWEDDPISRPVPKIRH